MIGTEASRERGGALWRVWSSWRSACGSARSIGKREREIGGGGMSRVCVATERALGRRVVVNVLPAELSGQESVDGLTLVVATVTAAYPIDLWWRLRPACDRVAHR